jgi:hypothetical protein
MRLDGAKETPLRRAKAVRRRPNTAIISELVKARSAAQAIY